MSRFLAASLSCFACSMLASAAPIPKSMLKARRASLDGVWQTKEWYSNGRAVNSGMTIQWTVDGESLKWEYINQPGMRGKIRNGAEYSLKPAEDGTANGFDYTISSGGRTTVYKGIGFVEDETMRFAYAFRGADRPTSFEPAQGAVVYVFNRSSSK